MKWTQNVAVNKVLKHYTVCLRRIHLRTSFFRWRGSIYKDILPQLAMWLILYYSLNCCYRFALNIDQQQYVECEKQKSRMIFNLLYTPSYTFMTLSLAIIHICILDRTFEHVVADVNEGISFIPLSFVLGFYVSIVVTRYWSMWENLPRPEQLALRISSSIRGNVSVVLFHWMICTLLDYTFFQNLHRSCISIVKLHPSTP